MRSAGRAAVLLALAGACAGGEGEPPERPAADRRSLEPAPRELLRPAGHGTWPDPEDPSVLRAWVDARVANVRYAKRVFVEVRAPHGEAGVLRLLLPCAPRETGGPVERWGTDAIELYPAGGPGGAPLSGPVLYRLRMQHAEGGAERMIATSWATLHGAGAPSPPAADPWEAVRSPVRAREEGSLPEVLFAPFDDPGAAILARIRALAAAQRRDPGRRRTLHVAVMNVNDPELVEALVEAHRAGVEVRVIHDGRKHRPRYDWYRGDDRLLEAGVPLLGVRRLGRGAMHDKIVLFDGEELATGSMNWETGARFDNHENVLFTRERSVVAAYAARFEALAGGVLRPRVHAADPGARVSVSFAPDEAPHRIVGELLDAAERRVVLAMFTAKDVAWQEGGERVSLLGKLAAARSRGVEVTALIDHGIHEASEYYGVETEDDPIDEWLETMGVHVVRVDNPYGRYASMHHKTVVIDDAIAVTGAFNWYHDAAFLNDEDQLVWRDERVARRYLGEAVDLLRRYDPSFDPAAWPRARVAFEVDAPHTRWGEGVTVTGAPAELGAWAPVAGLPLAGWPTWRGELTLPLGVRFEAKAVLWGLGERWEPGPNRALQARDGVWRWFFGEGRAPRFAPAP